MSQGREIGEVMPDPPRSGKACVISAIGSDTQVSAISPAISLCDNEVYRKLAAKRQERQQRK
jgi:hypothetical protein